MPLKLPGGEEQRVAIARALFMSPPLLRADKPTGTLHSHTVEDIVALFRSLHSDEVTPHIVTHERYVSEYASRAIQLQDSRIVAGDSPLPEAKSAA